VVTVRRFRSSDAADVLRMSAALFLEGSTEEQERDLRLVLSRDDAAVFVAERMDGSVCGFVEAATRPYVDGCDSSPVGYIEAWYVDPDMRRSGVGRALLDAAEDWAVDRGYSEMGSDALIGNEISHRAHLKSGYAEVDRVVQFRKPLRAVEVSDRVRSEAHRRLQPELAKGFIGRLGRTPLPLLDRDDRAKDRERVHLALLKLVEAEPGRLDYHLHMAAKDWRDTLVAARM
jgi:aminoglycoside 6'-N-acetyltransferase I